jgi:5-formyltetrahydrofolate cyclo-ligase
VTDLAAAKAALRARVLARREAEPDRTARSRRIAVHLLALPELQPDVSLAAFIGVRSEVETADLVARLLALGRRVLVPRVAGTELELIELRSLDELVDAPFGLREPPPALAADPARRPDLTSLRFVLVPGVAFDRRGGRLGHGKGFYDRLLRRLPAEAVRVGVAFECQLVEEVPMGPADEPVDRVVTEQGVLRVSPERTASAGR